MGRSDRKRKYIKKTHYFTQSWNVVPWALNSIETDTPPERGLCVLCVFPVCNC